MLDRKQPDNLRVIPESAGMLQRIEDRLLNIVTVASTIIWWRDVDTNGQGAQKWFNTRGDRNPPNLGGIGSRVIRQTGRPW